MSMTTAAARHPYIESLLKVMKCRAAAFHG